MAVVSKDLAARVYSLHALEGYRVPTLAGHKDTPVGFSSCTGLEHQTSAWMAGPQRTSSQCPGMGRSLHGSSRQHHLTALSNLEALQQPMSSTEVQQQQRMALQTDGQR